MPQVREDISVLAIGFLLKAIGLLALIETLMLRCRQQVRV